MGGGLAILSFHMVARLLKMHGLLAPFPFHRVPKAKSIIWLPSRAAVSALSLRSQLNPRPGRTADLVAAVSLRH